MPSAPNLEFLRRAIQLATENVVRGAGGPFGALIVRDGHIVAEAANSVTASNDPTAHAEVNAIRAAARRWAHSAWPAASCTPVASLPMCLAAAYWAHIQAFIMARAPPMRPAPASTMRFSMRSSAAIKLPARCPQRNCLAMRPGPALPHGSLRRTDRVLKPS